MGFSTGYLPLFPIISSLSQTQVKPWLNGLVSGISLPLLGFVIINYEAQIGIK